MLDIKFVRTNPDAVKENIKKKFQDDKLPLVDEVLALDVRNREIKGEVEVLRAEKNKISKQIGAVCQRRSRNEGYREEVITQCNFKGNNEKEFKYHHIGSRSALPEQLQDTLRKV